MNRSLPWLRSVTEFRSARWDSLALSQRASFHIAAERLYCAALEHSDARYLLCGARGQVVIYDCEPGFFATIGEPSQTELCRHHARPVAFAAARVGSVEQSVSTVAWYPFDTGLFVTGGSCATVDVWSTNEMTVTVQFRLGAPVRAVAMSPCASAHALVAVAPAHEHVRLCDLRSGGFTQTLRGHAHSRTLAWSTSAPELLACGDEDGRLILWDVRRSHAHLHAFDRFASGALDRPFGDDARPALGGGGGGGGAAPAGAALTRVRESRMAHDGRVLGLAFAPDGLTLASVGADRRVRLWDPTTGARLAIHLADVSPRPGMRDGTLCFADDGRLLLHADDTAVGVYSAVTGERVQSLRGHFRPVVSVAAHAGWQTAFSADEAGNVLMWRPSADESSLPALPDVQAAPEARAVIDADAWSESDG